MKNNYKKNYNLCVKNKNTIDTIKCNSKDLLKYNPKLIVTANNEEIYRLDNVQSLYLFPLTVIDYINNIECKHIININIIGIDCSLNYKELFNNEKFKYLKAVEILIKDNYTNKEIMKICDIIECFYKKGVFVSLNIKDLTNLNDCLEKKLKYITYFKIFLQNDLSNDLYTKFLNKLLLINNLKKEESLVHIKTYLNIEKCILYEKMINDFSNVGVDVFQVSKELIPLGYDNVKVDYDIQKIIRDLELKYNNYETIKFISVKDITTLYYPRFELDERNSRNCYSCHMKPYLLNDRVLPCKVNKVLSDLENWSLKYSELDKYESIFNKCGIECDDCASMFENDLLYDIEKIIKNNENIICYLTKE